MSRSASLALTRAVQWAVLAAVFAALSWTLQDALLFDLGRAW
jgi:hypothetical protein